MIDLFVIYFILVRCIVLRGVKKVGSGNGFKLKDTVTVSIDFKANNVSWKVNGQLPYTFNFPELKSLAIRWVPFILLDKDDSISLIP